MPQDSANQIVNLFPLVMGSVFILLAIFNKQVVRLMRLKPMSDVFTTPRFRRSALINETLGRILFLVFGLGLLIEGAGLLFLPGNIANALAWVVAGLGGLIVLAMIGVILFHWKA